MNQSPAERRKFLRKRVYLYFLFVIIIPAALIVGISWYLIVQHLQQQGG